MVSFDTNKTLNDIEKYTLDDTDKRSNLVKRCVELRDKKLIDFNTEDLRVMIGQNISLNYLIPLALDVLVNNPFAEGDLYIGDLLEQVLRVDNHFWSENKNLRYELDEIIVNVQSVFDTLLPMIKEYQSNTDSE